MLCKESSWPRLSSLYCPQLQRQVNYRVQNRSGCVCVGGCVLCTPMSVCTFAWKASHASLSDNRAQNPSQRWLSCSAAWAMSSARLPSGGADKTRRVSHQSNTHWYIPQSPRSYNSSPCRGQINTPFMQTESAQCYWRWAESRSKLQSEFIQLYADVFSSKWHLLNANGQFDV